MTILDNAIPKVSEGMVLGRIAGWCGQSIYEHRAGIACAMAKSRTATGGLWTTDTHSFIHRHSWQASFGQEHAVIDL